MERIKKTGAQFLEEVEKGLVTSSGGVLSGGDFNSFFDKLPDSNKFLGRINLQRITKPTMGMHSIVGAERLLSAQDTTNGYTRQTITPTKRTLTPVTCGFTLDVTFDQLQDMIVAPDADAYIEDLLVKLTANDIVDLCGNGTGTSTGFLSLIAGLPTLALADATVNDYAATNTTYLGAAGVLSLMEAVAEEPYIEDSVFLLSRSERSTVMAEMETRATNLGDAVLSQGGVLTHHGNEIIAPRKWPNDKAMLLPLQNIVVGLWHEIRVGREMLYNLSKIAFTVEVRLAINYAVGDGIVLGITS